LPDFQDEFKFNNPRGKKWPEHPGFKKTDTSEDAADKMVSKAATMRGQCLEMVNDSQEKGVASDEAALSLGFIVVSTRPRFSELKEMGLIVDSGKRRLSAYGAKQIVWVLPRYHKMEE
jgi:hypothetical protein